MDLINVLVALAIMIVIFLVCREIVCWYWKLNKVVQLQEDQSATLKSILAALQGQKNVGKGTQLGVPLETSAGTSGKIITPKSE